MGKLYLGKSFSAVYCMSAHKPIIAQLMKVQEPWILAGLEMTKDSSPRPITTAMLTMVTYIPGSTCISEYKHSLCLIFGIDIYKPYLFKASGPRFSKVCRFLNCFATFDYSGLYLRTLGHAVGRTQDIQHTMDRIDYRMKYLATG